MVDMKKEDRLNIIHEAALSDFDKIQTSLRFERQQCLEDRRFYSIAGAQWEGRLGEQFTNKPKFEVNKVHLSVIRIINEYRNNRISVSFVSKDGKDADSTAETCADLFRSDEQDSTAEEAYDNAFEEAVGGGFGAFRLRSKYEDEEDYENEYQRICIEPIYDADSCVFFDLNAKRQDKSDANFAFVLSAMTYDAFEDEWGVDVSTINRTVHKNEFDWTTADLVYIAEYYKVEYKRETIQIYRDLMGDEEKVKADEEEKIASLIASGYELAREKRVKCKRVHKYILSGDRVLDDCGYIAGKNIPIVPVYGKRWFIDGIERCMGHVRLCKDAQRLKNMQLSKLGEISALSSVQKPILTPEQIVGHEQMWAEDNIKDYPFLLINSMKDQAGNTQAVGPAAYTQPPQIPQALAALLQTTEQDMQDILGNQGGGEQIQSNLSGRAVELIQNRLDMQSFIYISNMAKAMKRCGEIWLGMATDVYVEEERTLKTVGEQGEISSTELVKPIMLEGDVLGYENDLSKAKFDVAVDVGPTSSSKRAATVRSLSDMLPLVSDPETAAVLQGMIMMNMEGDGIMDVRDYFRQKLIRLGAVKPTEEEQQQIAEEEAMRAQQPPSAQDQYLQSESLKNQSLADKAMADTDLTKAKTIETISKVDIDQQKQAIESAKMISQEVSAPPSQVSEY